jgi:hypothetical protein
MSDWAFGVSDAGTVGTMDVWRLGREVPGCIQGDKLRAVDRPHRLLQPCLLKGLIEFIEEAEQVAGLHWI